MIGYVDGSRVALTGTQQLLAAIRKTLAANGFVEGKDFRFEFREAEGQFNRLQGLYRELVDQKVTVIVAPSTAQLEAAKSVTQTIPIIFLTGLDPVGKGFVVGHSRPDLLPLSSSHFDPSANIAVAAGKSALEGIPEMPKTRPKRRD